MPECPQPKSPPRKQAEDPLFSRHSSQLHSIATLITFTLVYTWGSSPTTATPYLISGLFVALYAKRIHDYHKRKMELDLFNLCYVAWFILIYYLLFDPQNTPLFIMLWAFGMGHGGVAVWQFHNTIVFHRLDITTSCLTHIGGNIILFNIRWMNEGLTHNPRYPSFEDIQLDYPGFVQFNGLLLGLVGVWTLAYLVVLHILKQRMEEGGNLTIGKWALRYVTWMKPLFKLVPPYLFDEVWSIVYLASVWAHSLVAYFCLHSYVLSVLNLLFQFGCVALASGTYYTVILPKYCSKTVNSGGEAARLENGTGAKEKLRDNGVVENRNGENGDHGDHGDYEDENVKLGL